MSLLSRAYGLMPLLALMGGYDGRTPSERVVDNNSLGALIDEYNLILKKKSRLSRNMRDRSQPVRMLVMRLMTCQTEK